MSNEKVIIAFLNNEKAHTPTRDITRGYFTYKGQTLNTNGKELINYNTTIAYHKDGKLYLNVRKYSSTTSHIQSKLRRLAEERSFQIVEYEGEI